MEQFQRVIEGVIIDTHPITQAIPGGIGEGTAGFVDANAGRLGGDEDFCSWRDLEDGPRTKGEVSAECASTGFLYYGVHRRSVAQILESVILNSC